jgi:hypothetical protein
MSDVGTERLLTSAAYGKPWPLQDCSTAKSVFRVQNRTS